MMMRIPGLLSPEALAFVNTVLGEAVWADGDRTVGAAGRAAKHNLELDPRSRGTRELQELVHAALAGHPLIADRVLPLRFSRPIIARYDPGMEYGRHVDNPLLGGAQGMMRTDVSVTVFLNDPDDYDGGELVLFEDAGEQPVKLPRGDAVAYTTGTPHRVAPVTRGARLVAVCWIQSVVADPHQRDILSALHRAHHALVAEAPDSPATGAFLEGYYALMRLWARV